MTAVLQRTQRRRDHRGGVSLIGAVAVFAIICGAILTIGTVEPARQSDPAIEARERGLTPLLLRAVDELHKAEASLNAANYGECRRLVGDVRRELTGLLTNMHEMAAHELAVEPHAM